MYPATIHAASFDISTVFLAEEAGATHSESRNESTVRRLRKINVIKKPLETVDDDDQDEYTSRTVIETRCN
jgi:hypothetical protein